MLSIIGILILVLIVGFGIVCLIGNFVYWIDCFKNTDSPFTFPVKSNNIESTSNSCVVVTRKKNGRTVHLINRTTSIVNDRGWTLEAGALRGYYQTKHGSYEGIIKQPSAKKPSFFIAKPKKDKDFREKILNGPHSACFRHKGRGVYSIHFAPNKPDLNTGILCVENCIEESLS